MRYTKKDVLISPVATNPLAGIAPVIPQWPKQKEPTNSQMDVSIAAQLVIQVEIGKADRGLLLSPIPLSF